MHRTKKTKLISNKNDTIQYNTIQYTQKIIKCIIFLFHKYNTYIFLQMGDAITAANSQNMQYQQMQMMNQMTQFINSANAVCAKGTECYQNQQVINAQNEYQAALLTEKKAPEMVETSFKKFFVASKGENGANEALKQRYLKNGEEEQAKFTQEFNQWYNEMSTKLNTNASNVASIKTLSDTNARLEYNLSSINQQDDDATNALNLLERKIHYRSEDISLINNVEYYIKLIYWLAFLTWIACIVYERRFTMKTGGLFVLFTVFILLQNYIMGKLSFIIPADMHVKW